MAAQFPGVVVIAALFLPLIAAGYSYYVAFEQTRPWLPQPLQEDMAARFAINHFIWSDTVPDSARRHYVRSHIFGCIAFGVITLFLTGQFAIGTAPLLPVLLSGGLTVAGIAFTVRLWQRLRRPHQSNTSPPATAP